MSINRPGDLAALNGLSHLDDPLRRQLYEYVIESDGPVSREQAAAAASIGRTLAAYHLDKLAEAGLLTVSYQRPAGRGGPGAGRPAKLYTRAAQEITVSVPPRDYELLARLLVASVEQDASGAVQQAVNSAAHEAGRRAGARDRGKRGGRAAQLRLPAPRRRRWPHQSAELPVSFGRSGPPRRGVRAEFTPRRGGHRRVWSPARARRTRSGTLTGAAWWCTTRSPPHAHVADADPIQRVPADSEAGGD